MHAAGFAGFALGIEFVTAKAVGWLFLRKGRRQEHAACFGKSAHFSLLTAFIPFLNVKRYLVASTVQGSRDHHLGWIPTTTTTGSSIYNKGSIAEYMAEDGDEFEMNTKINGCIQATNKYTES
ncbi:hypothetical protein POTOM_048738 [Populus tomentosa]|uniref:Uncharacterized protein n=1 Tax=Populus tomentosa TaxID=118781 RepID=A0A8X8CAW9_POPTO|nr:hypothetical protein POTOM_048738 [Populus tomentosa]